MRRIFLLLSLLIPLITSAMKIEKDEIDEFTGKRTVITSWEGADKGYIHIRFRLQNNKEFLDFKFMNGDAIVISEGESLLMKSTTDSIGVFKAIKTYHGGLGDGAVGMGGSKMWGVFATYSGDLSFFASNPVRLIRIYEVEVYYDKKVTESEARKFVKLYELFSQTINNEPGKSSFANYTVKYMKRKTNGKKWEVVKEDYKENMSTQDLNDIKSEWQRKSTDTYEYDVQFKKSK